jgi:hypothetical protein
MKSRIIILLFSYFLLFNSCMVDNFEEGSLVLDSITEIKLTSNDTLFLKKDEIQQIKYSFRYFSKQREVNLKNTVKPIFYLNGLEVEKTEINLGEEANYVLQAEFPNNPKILSNVLNIRVLSLINAITDIKLELKGESNVLIPELENPSFDDLFKIELSLLTGEKLIVNQSFFDFKYVLNGVSSDSFKIEDFELGKFTEVQIGINDVVSNTVSLEVLSVEGAIVEIGLEYTGESNILIPELQEVNFDELIKIEFTLANGNKLNIEIRSIEFQYFLNGKPYNSLKIQDFEEGKVTELQIGINGVVSNAISLEVLSIEQAISEIALQYLGESNILIPELQEVNFEELLELELTLINGIKLKVGKSDFDFEFLLNGEAYKKLNVEDFELGKVTELKIAINDVVSNPIKLEVYSVEKAITEIDLQYLGESKILIPELEQVNFENLFKAEFTLINGVKLSLGQSSIKAKFLLNGKAYNKLELQNFELDKVTEVKIAVNDVVSNSVVLEVLTLKGAVTELELNMLNNTRQFNKKETQGELFDLFELKAKLKNSKVIDLKPYKDIFHLELNQVKLTNFKISQIPDGKFEFRAGVGSVYSNTLEIEVFDPMTYIKQIDLLLGERTRNIYAVAGSSKLDFDYQVIGMDNAELTIPATLYVDGQKQASFKNIPINKAGIVNIQAEISGKKSNTIQIISRQNQVLPKIRVPIIFHVLDNLNKEISKSVIDFEMEKLNAGICQSISAPA